MRKSALAFAIAVVVAFSSLTTANVLDTFVFAHPEGKIAAESEDFGFDSHKSQEGIASSAGHSEASAPSESSSASAEEKTTATLLTATKRLNNRDVTYHLVDIHLARLSDLRTKISTNEEGNYGPNITKDFKALVNEAEADEGTDVLAAISGDFPFWKGRKGYVVRNGVTYRSEKRKSEDEDFAIFKDGAVQSYKEDEISFEDLRASHGGIYQNWSFGPALIQNGVLSVDKDDEIDNQTMSHNQRTAIGYAGANHFYFLSTTINGSRNSSRAGSFRLYDLATTLLEAGCTEAYNLDGGGSAAIYFDDQIIEDGRELGDIIYVVAR